MTTPTTPLLGRLRALGPIVSDIYRNVALAGQKLGIEQEPSSGVSDVERAMNEAADAIEALTAERQELREALREARDYFEEQAQWDETGDLDALIARRDRIDALLTKDTK